MPNRLQNATSPYLLQHAHNPVDWYEWGPDALKKAADEDKPILVSIGYSACHWCHVMERESFEDADIAAIMNTHFVCIKVDREERPDIDQIYMDAVQAMNQRGGWPLNVFLTPAQEPFFGGTYFPPPRWAKLLQQIHQAFTTQRKEINDSAASLRSFLNNSETRNLAQPAGDPAFDTAAAHAQFAELKNRFDFTWGGIDKAPKFVMPSVWQWLLRYHAATGAQDALHMVTLTLKKMSNGGLYDQLAGGFARYSVDSEWFAPHFEKMLYDNGQLMALYAESFAVTGEPRFAQIVMQTANWLRQEMTHPEGGLYAALDADSEGMEGKFYTWTLKEWEAVVGKDAPATAFFQLSEPGNWEHGRNILFRDDTLAWPDEETEIARLLAARNTRNRPALDDKLLAGWNAIAISGLATAYRYVQEPALLEQALAALHFVENRLIESGKLYRSYRNTRSSTEGFLEDYAWLIAAYISLYQATFNETYLFSARRWTEYVQAHFSDPADDFFFFTSSAAEPLIARKKEVFDNVIPASNSVMARNLFLLGTLLDHQPWIGHAKKLAGRLDAGLRTEPVYLSYWGILHLELTFGLAEVVFAGRETHALRQAWDKTFHPFALLLGASAHSRLALTQNRHSPDGRDTIYVCHNKTCQMPVHTVTAARALAPLPFGC
jgi:uncharacterized protein YyaL (SSP411 family)